MKFSEERQERTQYQYLPRADARDNRAGEITDYEFVQEYGAVAAMAGRAITGALADQVDEAYREMGAKVVRGISYSGEDPARLWLR